MPLTAPLSIPLNPYELPEWPFDNDLDEEDLDFTQDRIKLKYLEFNTERDLYWAAYDGVVFDSALEMKRFRNFVPYDAPLENQLKNLDLFREYGIEIFEGWQPEHCICPETTDLWCLKCNPTQDGLWEPADEPYVCRCGYCAPLDGQETTQEEGAGMTAPLGLTGTTAGLSGAELEKAPILLPSEFFDGCPELEIIRQAAHSRMVSPTALAMVLLARIASMADHRLRLPALVGSHVGLSFYTVLTAKVGGGKSSTTNLAAELLGHDPTSSRQVEVITGNGTGEGLIQKHMGRDEDNPKGPPVQVLHNVFWYIDEGMNLVKEFERRGSQAAGILCSGWFCAGVGQNNATGELQRSLRPLSYNWGIVIAIQDDNAHHLLDQQGIGLTQRCLWVEGWDPTIPDPDHMPDWPGSLDWRHPEMPGDVPVELRGHLSAPDHTPRHIKLPDWYEQEHKWALYRQKQTGKVDALGEHIILMEIKLAVLLGMLRGHLDPDDDDIRRARLAIAAHKKQIRRAANRVRLAEAESNLVNAQKAVEKAETRESMLIQRFRDKVLDALSDGKTATWRQLRDKVRGSTRKEMGGEEALADIMESMIDEGTVQCLGGEGMNTIYSAGDVLGT